MGRFAVTRCWWKVKTLGSLASMVALTQWFWASPKVVTLVKFSMTFGPASPAALVVAAWAGKCRDIRGHPRDSHYAASLGLARTDGDGQ